MCKFLSVLLAMAMVFSLTVTGFALEDTATTREPEVMTEEATMAGKTVILHTNDVHGAVEGYAYIAQLKADYEAKGAEVILVDAGDFSQGTTYVSSTKGADAVTMMNAAGYDVVTLGNHEFDYGYAQLKENMSKAKFKVVCADVFNEDGTPTARSAKILNGTPTGRFVDAEELLGATLFLCDDKAASAITGVVLPIDAGFSAYSGV